MLKVISNNRIPIKMWLYYVEDGALDQASNLANLPFAFHHIALMPDCHQGYGMPIGGVMTTDNVIVPNAVGKDIGCGMCAIKTNIRVHENAKPFPLLKNIRNEIEKAIPVGYNWNEKPIPEDVMPELNGNGNLVIVKKEFENARLQCGTLGSGNHFIEIQAGSDGYLWIMLHSGSRNLGTKVADYYNKVAIELNEKWCSNVPKSWQLAFLPFECGEAQSYFNEMKYCVDFAFLNRKTMMDRIEEIFINYFPSVIFEPMINIAHNYAAIEHHFGRNVIVHRKGATRAREGEIGIIPGAQGSKSYIVRGKGNNDSFMSCSHGAGRKMGRNKAKEHLDLKVEQKKLDDQGIIHSMNDVSKLDEALGAYKDIDEVMNNQNDLVDILVELRTLAVVKG